MGVRIAGYSAGERLLILAPPEIHTEIRGIFAEEDEQDSDRPAQRTGRTSVATSREPAAPRRESADVRRKPAVAQADKRIKQVSVPRDTRGR